MKIIWHEAKREKNLHKHGLDFEDAYKVFSGFTFTFEDDRYVYGDQRFVTVGLILDVVIVHTETSVVWCGVIFRYE